MELPPLEAAAPVEGVVAAEEIPAWLKELGMAEAEEAVAPVSEVPVVELPLLRSCCTARGDPRLAEGPGHGRG